MQRQLFDAVINEINLGVNTIQNANKIFKRQCNWNPGNVSNEVGRYFAIKAKYDFCRRDNGTCSYIGIFYTVFGAYEFDVRLGVKLLRPSAEPVEKIDGINSRYLYKCGKLTPLEKNGIEVLGMKPDRTSDGKYTYKGLVISQLKDKCKMNGIKGLSKLDKTQLVNALIKC